METLKTSAEFERVRREGRTWVSGLVVLNAAPADHKRVRCGFIAGKKIGKAVVRNRARRLIKEAVRLRLPSIKPGWDLVWIARAPIVGVGGRDVSLAVEDLLARSKLYPYERVVAETDARQSRIIDKDAPAQDGATPVLTGMSKPPLDSASPQDAGNRGQT